MPRQYDITNKKTGKTYTVDWKKNTDPTPEDMKRMVESVSNLGNTPEEPSVSQGMKGGDYAAMGLRGLSGLAVGSVPGALAAGAVEMPAQFLEKTFGTRKEYDPKQVAVEATIGAIPFGKMAKTGSALTKALVAGGKGALVGAGGEAIREVVNEQKLDPSRLLKAGAISGVAGGLGHAVLSRFSSKAPTVEYDPSKTMHGPDRSDFLRVHGPERFKPAGLLGEGERAPGYIGTPDGRLTVNAPGADMGVLESLRATRPTTDLDPFSQVGRQDVAELPSRKEIPVTRNPMHDEPRISPREAGMRTTPEGRAVFDLAPNSVKYGESGQFKGEQFDLAPDSTVMPTDRPRTAEEIMADIYDEMEAKANAGVKAPKGKAAKVKAPKSVDPPLPKGMNKAQWEADRARRVAERNAKLEANGIQLPPSARPTVNPAAAQKEVEAVASKVKDVKSADPKIEAEKLKAKAQEMANAPAVRRWGGNKFMSAFADLGTESGNWIKARQAAKVAADNIRYKFKDSIGHFTKENLPDFQRAITEGKFDNVRQYFDNKLNWLKSQGVMIDRKDDYLPQLWDNTPEEIARVFDKSNPGGKRLSVNAPFTHQSVYKDYAEGTANGLKPRMSPLELMEWYEHRANTLVADRKFFNFLKANKYVVERGPNTPQGWLDIDSNHVPASWKVGENKKTGAGEFAGFNWATDPKLKSVLDNYLKGSHDSFGASAARVAGTLKELALSSGIPKTAINSYGIWQAKRAAMEGGVSRLGTAVKLMLNPRSGERMLNEARPRLEYWTKEGANFKPARPDAPLFDNPNGNIAKGVTNWAVDKQRQYFEKPLYDQMLPALKLTALEDNLQKFMKAGMSEKEAAKAAVDHVATMYSNINYDLIYRSNNFQNVMRAGLLAPGILESNARVAKAIPKAMLAGVKAIAGRGPLDPVNKAYTQVAGRMAAAYMAANVVNMAATGKPMWDNPKGHEFDIAMGKDSNGEQMWLRVFGTESDFVRIPYQVAMGVANDGSPIDDLGRIVSNKSSLLARPFTENILTGEDFQGNPNLGARNGQDTFGNPVSWGKRAGTTAVGIAGSVLPPVGNAAIGLAKGDSIEKAILSSIESPVVFSRKPKAKTPAGLKVSFRPSVR